MPSDNLIFSSGALNVFAYKILMIFFLDFDELCMA